MNKAIPETTVNLDKERHLKFTLGSIIRFKESTGKDLRDPAVNKQISENMELEDLCAFVWACLRHEDKTLTLEDVEDMIDMNNLADITKSLSDVLAASMPNKGNTDPEASRSNG